MSEGELTNQDKKERKRFYTICIVFAAIVIGILFLIWPKSSNNTTQQNTNVALTSSDKQSVNSEVESFVKKAGSFGFDFSTLNASNLGNVDYLVSTGDYKDYVLPRQDRYRSLLNDIDPKGLSYYDDATINNWDTSLEIKDHVNYVVNSVSADSPDKGFYVVENNKNVKAVEVPAKYSSTSKMVYKEVMDSTWDGSYNVRQKEFQDEAKIVLTLADNGQWKVYSVTSNHPFLLATWKNADGSSFFDQRFLNTNIVDVWKNSNFKPASTPTNTP